MSPWVISLLLYFCLRLFLTLGESAQVVRIVETDQDSLLPVDTQLRQGGRRYGKLPVGLGWHTKSEAEEELERATMGHEPDGLILTSDQHIDIGCLDALCHLQQGFAAWRGAVELIMLPGGQALSILLLNLGIRQTFPASKGHLPQAGF